MVSDDGRKNFREIKHTMNNNMNLNELAKAFAKATRAAENDARYEPDARAEFRAIARHIWRAAGKAFENKVAE